MESTASGPRAAITHGKYLRRCGHCGAAQASDQRVDTYTCPPCIASPRGEFNPRHGMTVAVMGKPGRWVVTARSGDELTLRPFGVTHGEPLSCSLSRTSVLRP